FADQHQLSGIWIPERHFASFGDQFPNPAVAAAAVAAITENVTIRSGSVVLPLHDPVRVAEEWSMVDNLSNGRVELSFASGWHPNDFIFAPQSYQKRHQVMWDNIETVQRLWQGHSIKRRNGVDQEIDIELHPKPIQAHLPVWITAAGNEQTFRSAGAMGANLLTHMLGQDHADLQRKIAIYRQALVSAGYDEHHGKVALMLHTFIADEHHDVKTIVQLPFKNYLRHSINLLKPLADEANLDIEEHLEAVVEMAFERYYHTSGLFGTVLECLSKIQTFQAIGVDEISCLIDFGVDSQLTIKHLHYLNQLKQKVDKIAAHQQLLANRQDNHWAPQDLIRRHGVTHLQATPS
ncbi:MAG: LLM class flavin-dependent oxidoreductase, partial [Psychrosphaera sp.]|nr:LLM class flavin-dependent oxidoreductase [Psychrosphaera sp.]